PEPELLEDRGVWSRGPGCAGVVRSGDQLFQRVLVEKSGAARGLREAHEGCVDHVHWVVTVHVVCRLAVVGPSRSRHRSVTPPSPAAVARSWIHPQTRSQIAATPIVAVVRYAPSEISSDRITRARSTPAWAGSVHTRRSRSADAP